MRRTLRDLAGIAYERELRRLLKPLGAAFARWQAGEMETGDLVAQLDAFSKGHAKRRLWEQYHTNSIIPMVVAAAFVRGILSEKEVPAEVRTVLEGAIEFYRAGLANGTVGFEDEDN